MAAFPKSVTLGRSGLQAGPLAVSGGYGVDAKSLWRALDRGVGYWYHGSIRRGGMSQAVREVVAAGRRSELAMVVQSYARWGWYIEHSLASALKGLKLDHADVLLLGWHNGPLPAGILERVARMKEKGMFRHLAISGHERAAFVKIAADPRTDILHIRYNAAHTGAEKDVFPSLPKEGRPGMVAYTATSWGQLLAQGKMPPGEKPLRGRDCYRFVLSNPDFQVCMTGPKDAAQMDEALAALDEGPLTPEESERFRRIGQHVHG